RGRIPRARGRAPALGRRRSSWMESGSAQAGLAQGPRHGGHAPGAASGRQAPAALGAAAGQDLAAVGGRHAGTEAVVALALEVAGLESALGGHFGFSCEVRRLTNRE